MNVKTPKELIKSLEKEYKEVDEICFDSIVSREDHKYGDTLKVQLGEKLDTCTHYNYSYFVKLEILNKKEEKEYFIYICKKCGFQMEESHMGKKCPDCEEWTYYSDCKKECVLKGVSE